MITADDGGDTADPFTSARGERRDAGYGVTEYGGVQEPTSGYQEHRDNQGTIEEVPAESDSHAPASSHGRVVTDDEREYTNKCSRICVFILAGVFAAAGSGIAILGRVELDHKVLPVCPDCENFATAMYIVGSAVAVFGLIGIAAAASRFKPLAFFYAFLLFLLAVMCFACGVAIVVFELGLKKNEVKRVWVQEVGDERQVICDLQQRLECSGFDRCCGVVDVNASITPMNTVCNITASVYMDQCDDRCGDTNQQFVEPCDEKVTDLIKAHFKPLIGTAFGLTVVLFAGVIMSVRMTFGTVAARRSINP